MNNRDGKTKIVKSSIEVIVAIMFSKFIAFLQESVIASYLGATVAGDAFNMVFGLQQTIYPMLSVGITQVFLPAYKKLLQNNSQEEADSLANYAIVFFTSASVFVAVLLTVFASFFVSCIAPGFSVEQRILTVHLVRLSSLSYVFICCASVISSILISHNKFFISEIRNVFTHVPVIIVAIFLYHSFGIDVLAISLVIGGILRLVIQLPFLPKSYHFSLSKIPDLQFIKTLFKKFPAALMSSAITQTNTFVDRIIASGLFVGSVSCLNYGFKLFAAIQDLISTSIGTSTYPTIIALIAEKKEEELSKFINKTLQYIWMFALPITALGILFSKEIINILFVHGEFTTKMGTITAGIFSAYLLSLCISPLIALSNNVFFGYGNTATPMKINMLNIMLNIVLNLIFVRFLSVVGLALATSISTIALVPIRVICLRTLIHINFNENFKKLSLYSLSSIFSLSIAFLITKFFVVNNIFMCVGIVFITMLIYFAVLFTFQDKNFVEMLSKTKKYLNGKF